MHLCQICVFYFNVISFYDHIWIRRIGTSICTYVCWSSYPSYRSWSDPIHPILSYPILSCPILSYPSEIFDLTAPKPRSSSSGSDNSWWILWVPNVASRRSNRIHHMFIHTYSVYNAQENPIKIQYGLHLHFCEGYHFTLAEDSPFPHMSCC